MAAGLISFRLFSTHDRTCMFRTIAFVILASSLRMAVFAQDHHSTAADTMKTTFLQEVVVISPQSLSDGNAKSLSTLDGYLEKASSVNMIRRGAYAWEPLLNGMSSERGLVTIDGMRIYGACTDKMDPVTSYVEISNLAKADVHSGQEGSAGGATIAGSVDLVRRKGTFNDAGFDAMVFSGFETNNRQKIAGTSLSYSKSRVFTDANVTYRKAQNYKAGGGEEVLYSPFTKFNMSAIAGYKINEHQHIEASLIYDRATDVGYPALPMDVSLAKAFIGSVEYVRHQLSPAILQWKTKLYYNNVTHIMDDTKRPVVPIRMDMPGWSKTTGFYSSIEGSIQKHAWKVNLSAHHNHSLAEMTMFSNTPDEKDMFMLTWPGVDTNYSDIFAEDTYSISKKWKTILRAGLGVHNNLVSSQFGLESLRIFYPDMDKTKTRLLKRVAASFQYEEKAWQYALGIAYGERAPGVSEGYGFYLFNSFDRFDYIGNPDLKNERSSEFNASLAYKRAGLSAKITGAYFYIADYIIGRPATELSVMTIGANGVKIYEQLDHAGIFNATADLGYRFSDHWLLTSKLAYRRGTGAGNINLPLIQPLTCISGIVYSINTLSIEGTLTGAVKQKKYNPDFGETPAPAYTVFNLSASYQFMFVKQSVTVKTGAENMFDKYYTTFSDWNRLPRMGRNIFINLIWDLK